MICDARIIVERLLENRTLTEKDILEMEIFVRRGCSQMKACEQALNKYLIARELKRKEREHPTTQEQDRKGCQLKPSAPRKTWFRSVGRILGRIKKPNATLQ